MFGVCHWFAMRPMHPWNAAIQRLHQELGTTPHPPHVTIQTHARRVCLDATHDAAAVPSSPVFVYRGDAPVSITSSASDQGTLWALEIPLVEASAGWTRFDGENVHLSLAYRWDAPFLERERRVAETYARTFVSAAAARTDIIDARDQWERQVWCCNASPSLWVRLR